MTNKNTTKTARIIHLDRQKHFPRLPAGLLEIDGEVYVDMASMMFSDISKLPKEHEIFDLCYQLELLPANAQRAFYSWENLHFAPLVNVLVAIQFTSLELPIWVQVAEAVLCDYTGREKLTLSVDYGAPTLVEVVYNTKLAMENPESHLVDKTYKEILAMPMATIDVQQSMCHGNKGGYAFYRWMRLFKECVRYRSLSGIWTLLTYPFTAQK